ncbi:MAG: oxidoreductase, partial [Alphaproteobacteria bacterium]|nr:oxidoreductase [Alphaproteobacteria bacterium]
HELDSLKGIREQSKYVITIGACATAGGVQALRNFKDVKDFVTTVYAHPEYISTLANSTPISDHIKVDYELQGCPINKNQLLEVLGALLHGRRANIPNYSVCVECKRRGISCVTVSKGIACLGPVTKAGCGAICPTYNRGCYGCFGSMETPNTEGLSDWLIDQKLIEKVDMMRMFRTITAGDPAFKKESERNE